MNKQILQDTLREWHSKTPDDVHGVGRSYKITNGVRTNELCVVFLVLHKKPLAELRSEEILPTSLVIDNETISTDVIEAPRFLALSSRSDAGTNCRNPPATTNRARHRPLVGGISISADDRGGTGTLGGLFRDKEDGSVVGLTNAHVVTTSIVNCTWSSHKNSEDFYGWDIENKRMEQPGKADDEFPTQQWWESLYPSTGIIGNIKRYYPLTTYIEMAVDNLNRPILVFPESGEINYIDAAVVGFNSDASLIGPRSGSQLGPPRYLKGIYRSTNTTPIQIWPVEPYCEPWPYYQQDPDEGTGGNCGYHTGQTVVISGHTGNTAANGTWKITSIAPNARYPYDHQEGFYGGFTLNGSIGNGVGTATGTINRQPWGGNVAAYPVATTAEIDNLVSNTFSSNNRNKLVISGRTTGYSGNTAQAEVDYIIEDTFYGEEGNYNNVTIDCNIYAGIDNLMLSVRYGGTDPDLVYADQIVIAYGDKWFPEPLEPGEAPDPNPGRSQGPIKPGDSGSIVLADFNGVLKIVGLVFAGGSITGIMSRIDHVMRLLNLEALGSGSMTSNNPPSNWSFIDLPSPYHELGSNTAIATITHNGLKYWECGKLTNGNTKYVTYTHKLSPSPPHNVVAVRGNGQVTLSWDAPYSNGGSPITDYIVKYSSNGGVAGSWKNFVHPVSTVPSLTVTGLTNGRPYVFKILAKNAFGIGLASANSAPATPATVPGSPTAVVAVSGNTQLAVTWTAPASTGGSAITDYLVKYSSNGGSTWTNFVHPVSTVPSLTVTGLTNGTAYVIKVIARNAIGISLPSVNSAPATPAATVPGRPTSVVAVRGNASLAVTWVAPASNGGSNIIEYIVKYSSNNGAAGSWTRYMPSSPITATSCTVTGLTNGTAYVIKVIAKNAVGISLPSVNSVPVTPATATNSLIPSFATPVTSIPLVFAAPITGFSVSHLSLFRNGSLVSLRGTTITGSGASYVIHLPSLATNLKGSYRLDANGLGWMLAPYSYYFNRI